MAYAAYTTARETNRSDGDIVSLKLAAVKVAKGTFAVADATAGYATTTPTASRPFFGVFDETVDNSGGSAGDKRANVRTTGVFTFEATGTAAQTWVGKEVWLSSGSSGNNKTVVASDPGVGPKVGRCVEFIDATHVRIRIDGYALVVDAESS
jgi:hypothetical protein